MVSQVDLSLPGCTDGTAPTKVAPPAGGEAATWAHKRVASPCRKRTASQGGAPALKAQLSTCSTDLSAASATSLRDFVNEKRTDMIARSEGDADSHAKGGGDHGHGAKPPSLLTAVPAAVINFLLMFGLCCAYGMIMFEDDFNKRHRGMAVKMNLGCAFLVGLLYAGCSGIPVAIGGPDLNPVVFLGIFVSTVASELAAQHGLDYPGDRRLLEQCSSALFFADPVGFLRRLGGSSSDVEFCTGAHLDAHAAACDSYHRQLAATTIFTVAVASLILGLFFFVLGRFRLTRYVTYIPINIVEAFLSCIGYKVFKYALKFSLYEPTQFIPAACVGVPMYFAKALHLGNPAIVIPVMLLVPLGIFYAGVFGQGGDLGTAREAGWMFAPIENADFWAVWSDSLGSVGDINFGAWAKTLPTLPVMIIVVLLDCMLKLSATESKIPVRPEKDREMMLFGMGNILTTLTGSSVGYMQLKFNVINYGVMGNVTDRRAGAVYALLCGLCYLWSTDLFNYLPRFFLSTLLFFAGAGFVAENLWGSRKYLSSLDWAQILIILAVFILTDSLLNAVIVGGLIACATFVVRYAQFKPVQGRPIRGGEIATVMRWSPAMELAIENMSNHHVVVVRLKGFLSFAPAKTLMQIVQKTIEDHNEGQPEHRRLRWLVLDCTVLDGLESSATKSLCNLPKLSREWHVKILWSGVDQALAQELKARGTVEDFHCCFPTLEDAKTYTESAIRGSIRALQEKWMGAHPWFQASHECACRQAAADPFREILSSDAARLGCPWKFCSRREMTRFRTQLWKPGDYCSDLILVKSGSVGLFSELPEDDGAWQAPRYVYTQGWLINREAVMHRQSTDYAICLSDGELIFWSEFDRGRMLLEQPHMTSAVLAATLRHENSHTVAALQDTNLAVKSAGGGGGGAAGSKEAECGRVHADKLRWIHDMEVTRSLSRQGFYDAVDYGDAVFPDLPSAMMQDLETAFYTLAEQPDKSSTLRATNLDAALSYAGLFDQILADPSEDGFTKEQFLAIGHEAAMLRLDRSMEGKIRDMFKQYANGKDEICPAKLVTLFTDHFYHDINVADVSAICDLYGTASERKLPYYGFLALMARFLRRHEADWRLFVAASHLLGTLEAGDDDAISARDLVDRGGVASTEEAEEMIWFANCCSGGTPRQADVEPETFDYRLLKALFFDTEGAASSLPPPPKSSQGEPTVGSERHAVLEAAGAVVDFRALDRNERPGTSGKAAGEVDGTVGEDEPGDTDGADEAGKAWSLDEDEKNLLPPRTCRQRLYQLLDEPGSSTAAHYWSLGMGMMILISVFTLVAQPLITPEPADRDIWWVIECYFTVLFGVELLVRFAVADAMGTRTQCDFIKTPMNVCDFIAILPFFIDLAMSANPDEFRLFRVFRFGRIARLLRLSRLARLGKLTSHHPAFAPIAVIMVVIWGIYIRTSADGKK